MEPQPEPESVLAILQKDYQLIKECLEDKQCQHTPQQIIELIFRSLMRIEDELIKGISSELIVLRELFTQILNKFHVKWKRTTSIGIAFLRSRQQKLKAKRTQLYDLFKHPRIFGYNYAPERLRLLFELLKKMGCFGIVYETFELMFFGNEKLTDKVIYEKPAKELVRTFYLLKLHNVTLANDYIMVICSNFKSKKGKLFNPDSLNSMAGIPLPYEDKLLKIIKLIKGE